MANGRPTESLATPRRGDKRMLWSLLDRVRGLHNGVSPTGRLSVPEQAACSRRGLPTSAAPSLVSSRTRLNGDGHGNLKASSAREWTHDYATKARNEYA